MVQTVCNIENIGKQQYNSYRQTLLVHGTKTINDPINRNSLRLSRNPTSKSKRSDKSRELKEDVSLFSRLYIASKAESDLGSFFMHQNHPYPPSLYDKGAIQTGAKSDLKKI